MTRFLVSPEKVKGDRITIEGREVHHLRNVLRLRKGERVICFDGRGKEYEGTIASFSPGQAEIKIEKSKKLKKELPLKITLAPSLIRASKMDLVIQKCTELGVFRLMPMRTERSLVKLDEAKSRARRERWQRLAEEAAKQSGRVQVPQIEEVRDFASILRGAGDFDLAIILWEEAGGEGSFKKVLTKRLSLSESVLLLIGPEGGFPAREVAEAKKAGLLPVSLGPRLLKAETAAIVAVAILAYEWGG
ncbi:16S rRNA (uracil(1498)-N(3))-methyltransferase [candidate division NPL-UPA2 bacterium]|nr:16S rRNA (uracil(1498)-N(3))-methyltransferase [candidate division NPL-UPA2 bacterium]